MGQNINLNTLKNIMFLSKHLIYKIYKNVMKITKKRETVLEIVLCLVKKYGSASL